MIESDDRLIMTHNKQEIILVGSFYNDYVNIKLVNESSLSLIKDDEVYKFSLVNSNSRDFYMITHDLIFKSCSIKKEKLKELGLNQNYSVENVITLLELK